MNNIRSNYRKIINKRRRQFDTHGYKWEIETDFARYSNLFHELYVQVWERSSSKFEKLTPCFFRNISNNLKENSYALICYKKDTDKIVGFELVLEDDHIVHPIYFGLDYTSRDDGAIYFNFFYKIIEIAVEKNKSVIHFGQTSYQNKAYLGTVIEQLYLGIYHTNSIMYFIIKLFKSQLFPATYFPDVSVYKKDVDALGQLEYYKSLL